MKNIKSIIFAAVAGGILCSGCYDLERYPDDKLSSGTFFKTEEHAKEATMAAYALLRSSNGYGLSFAWDGLGGICFGYDDQSLQVFQTSIVTANNYMVRNNWTNRYEGIARANRVLQNVDNCDMSDELKAQYKCEARFLRGLYYFNLLDFWGGVPIYDESLNIDTDFANMKKPRASVEEVRDFILADFEAALALPREWDAANHGRATWGAAMAMKGKTLLYAGQYKEASECFDRVIKSGLYELYPDYAGLFLPGGDDSSEMIFAIQNISGKGQEAGMPMCFYMGTRSTYGSCWNNVMAATSFVDSYEWADGRPFDWDEVFPRFNSSNAKKREVFCSTLNSNKTAVRKYTAHKNELLEMYSKRDPRMAASIILPYTHYTGWYKSKPADNEYVIATGMGMPVGNGMIMVNQNHEAYLWRKFVPEADMDGLISNRSHTPINFPLVRLADVYLMQAECLNELNRQAEAVEYINKVRARVGMPGINSGPAWLQANSKEQVFERIRHERAVELCAEGHSFSDMKRWQLLETLNGKEERYITGNTLYVRKVSERDYLWPIPTVELDQNPALVQNPGW